MTCCLCSCVCESRLLNTFGDIVCHSVLKWSEKINLDLRVSSSVWTLHCSSQKLHSWLLQFIFTEVQLSQTGGLRPENWRQSVTASLWEIAATQSETSRTGPTTQVLKCVHDAARSNSVKTFNLISKIILNRSKWKWHKITHC